MADAVTIVLPWPDKRLSPNARGHWRGAWAAGKSARAHAAWSARDARAKQLSGCERLRIHIVITPPDKRPRDTDNIIASLKPYLDGLADACGVDDSRWTWAAPAFTAPAKPGSIAVTLTPEAT